MTFPTLRDKNFCGPVNLDSYYQTWARTHYYACLNPSPALKPLVAQRMLADLHRERGADWSWGGLYEDRSHLWRGSYLAEKRNYVHLGVDLNVPAGTPVCADSPGKVILVDNDTDTFPKGGWGTRVMLRLFYHPVVLIYAHLAPGPDCAVGTTLVEGQEFARIGQPANNGYWFPHLHLQALSQEADEYYLSGGRLEELDGYGKAADADRIRRLFPDPMPYIRLP